MGDERSIVNEVMGILAAFERSSWQQCHLKTDALEMFVSRRGGAISPMRTPALPDATHIGLPSAPMMVLSSHLGTLRTAPATGERIVAGGVYATLDLLDETVELRAETAGVVAELLAAPGDLVEYHMPVITLTADPLHAG